MRASSTRSILLLIGGLGLALVLFQWCTNQQEVELGTGTSESGRASNGRAGESQGESGVEDRRASDSNDEFKHHDPVDPLEARISEILRLSGQDRAAAVRALAGLEDPVEAYDLLVRLFGLDPEPEFYAYQDTLLALFARDWDFLTTIAQDDFLLLDDQTRRILGLTLIRASVQYEEERELVTALAPTIAAVYDSAENVNLRTELALNMAAVDGLEREATPLLENFVRESDRLPTSQLTHVLPDFLRRSDVLEDSGFLLYRDLALAAKSGTDVDALVALYEGCESSAGLIVLSRHLPANQHHRAEELRERARALAEKE